MIQEVSDEKDTGSIVQDIIRLDVGGRGAVKTLAAAADRKQGAKPAMQAAKALANNVSSNDVVLIVTGFPTVPAGLQENDGPIGAASIARAVSYGLGANPLILCEPKAVPVCSAAVSAGGLAVVEMETSLESNFAAAVEPFPIDRSEARQRARKLIGELDPTAMIFIEKTGKDADGIFRHTQGDDLSPAVSKVDELLATVGDDVVTIAVGDGGNEIGMGKIHETIREEIPNGQVMGDTTTTDVLVPATVSNWGAHGIVTCLSGVTGQALLHTPDDEQRMLVQTSVAGGLDGANPRNWCDSMDLGIHESIIRLLREAMAPSFNEQRSASADESWSE